MSESDTAGRPLVLGIDFGGTKVALALAEPDGTVLAGHRLATDAAAGAAQVLDRTLAAAAELVATHHRPVAAVGAVSPGIVLPDRIVLAPNVPGWGELRLAERVGLAFPGVPVAVGTDAKAAGLAEARWGALRGADPGVYLSLGTGVAAAVIVGGRVLAGSHGAAGEIGYNLRGPADRGGHAHGTAPLEEVAGGRWLGDRARAELGVGTAAELFDRARRDPAAARLLGAALDELAVHIANLAITVDPARIAVGGGFARSADLLLPPLRARLDQAVPFPPELVPARFDQDAPLRGALALAVPEPSGL